MQTVCQYTESSWQEKDNMYFLTNKEIEIFQLKTVHVYRGIPRIPILLVLPYHQSMTKWPKLTPAIWHNLTQNMTLWLKLYFPDDVVFLFTFNIFVVKCLYSEFAGVTMLHNLYIENHSENCLPFGTPLGCDICYCLQYIRLLSEICLNQLAFM